jgi:hypothetical protein
MPYPTFVSVSAKATSTGAAVTPALPASMQTGDVVILVATTIEATSLNITANGSITNWVKIVADFTQTGTETLSVWVGTWTSGTTGPTVTPSGGDHCCAATFAYRGVDKDFISKQGDTALYPVYQYSDSVSNTTISVANNTTPVRFNESLVIMIIASGVDSNTAQVSVLVNNGCINETLRAAYQTASGTGGGFGLTDGQVNDWPNAGNTTGTLVSASTKIGCYFFLHALSQISHLAQHSANPYIVKRKIQSSGQRITGNI